MANLTSFGKGALLAHVFRTASAHKPTALYIALFHADGSEVTGGSYARVLHGPGDTAWRDQTSGNGITSNIGTITFPAPTADWGAIAKWQVIDDAGNVWLAGDLVTPKTVNNGDPAPNFPDGAFAGTFS